MLASTFFLLASSLTAAYAGLGNGMHESPGYRRHRFRRIHGDPHKHNSTIPACLPHRKLNTTSPTTPTSIPSPYPQPTHVTNRTDNITSPGPGYINTVTKPGNSGQYKLQDLFHGNSFFDGFNFYDGDDYTNGLVHFLSKSDAKSKKLAYVENGVVVMKVDDSTPGSRLKNGKRDAVRISSKKRYNRGLFVLDLAAMPYGKAVWPAYWTVGSDWPGDGEIDIIEGINMNTKNQYTIHTTPGCSIDTSSSKLASNIGSKDCNAGDGHNGCAFFDPDTNSYGEGLNNAGGGVFVMLWESNAIKIWRFPPNNVPSDLKNQVPNPDSWDDSYLRGHLGGSSSCDVGKYFKQHSITFDITLCGDWAGSAYQGGNEACARAVGDASNFKNAAWRVSSLQVYQ